MEVELSAIERNKKWELISMPVGKQLIGVKWIFRGNINPMEKLTNIRPG